MEDKSSITLKYQEKSVEVERSSVSDFEQLKVVLQSTFTNLPDKIQIYYIDSDSDQITLSCNYDLQSFFHEDSSLQVIFIKPFVSEDESNEELMTEGDSDDIEVEQIDFDSDGKDEFDIVNQNEKEEVPSPISSEHDQNYMDLKKLEQNEIRDKEELKQTIIVLEKPQDEIIQSDQQNCSPVLLQEASAQVNAVELVNLSIQVQTDVIDKQNQTQPANLTNSENQTIHIEMIHSNNQTQLIQQVDSEMQAQTDQKDYASQIFIEKNDLSMQTQANTEEQSQQTQTESLKQEKDTQSSQLQNQVFSEKDLDVNIEKIKVLEENQAALMKVIQTQQSEFEKKLSNLSEGLENKMVDLIEAKLNKKPSPFSKVFEKFENQLSQLKDYEFKGKDEFNSIFDSLQKRFVTEIRSTLSSQINFNQDDEEEEEESKENYFSSKMSIKNQIVWKQDLNDDSQPQKILKPTLSLHNQQGASNKEESSDLKGTQTSTNLTHSKLDATIDKANQIAQITQKQPSIYLKFVRDYSERSVNELVDLLFNENIINKYFS